MLSDVRWSDDEGIVVRPEAWEDKEDVGVGRGDRKREMRDGGFNKGQGNGLKNKWRGVYGLRRSEQRAANKVEERIRSRMSCETT